MHEGRWVLLIGLIAGILTLGPVALGYLHATETGRVFNGFDFMEDSHSYAAYVLSGVHENPLFLKDSDLLDLTEFKSASPSVFPFVGFPSLKKIIIFFGSSWIS